jgi:hypothetical protein
MEVLHFSNNVEMVALAKNLLTAVNWGGPSYKYSVDRMTCLYRQHRAGEKEPRRCIFGRLMYGHIDEDHRFWRDISSIKELFLNYPIFREKFPWMNVDVAQGMQKMHDDAAMALGFGYTWKQVESMAKTADEEFFAA